MQKRRDALFEAGDAFALLPQDAFNNFQAADDVVQSLVLQPTRPENGEYDRQRYLDDGQQFWRDLHIVLTTSYHAPEVA